MARLAGRGAGGRNLHAVPKECVMLVAGLVLFTSYKCAVAHQAHGTLRCVSAGGGGPQLPQSHGGLEGLCIVPFVPHFRPHGSTLVLEQRRTVSRHDSKAGIPAQLLFHLLSVPRQVTFFLGFCLCLCLDGREVDGLLFKV